MKPQPMEQILVVGTFAALGGIVVWRMFVSPVPPTHLAFACPLCTTRYAFPGSLLGRPRTRLRCSVCRGVFVVHDDETTKPSPLEKHAAHPKPRRKIVP